jgi:hypothetical protein
MKRKNLTKKIRRLEKRLQEVPKKLAKLRERLKAAEAAKEMKGRKKSAARFGAAKQPGPVKKAKRKVSLSPEGRAKLSALMRARWAAKRAAEANAKAASSDDQHSAPESTPQAPESRPNGA